MKIKLKYKKLIIVASMFILGIGTLTFSLSNKSKSDKETIADSKDVVEIDEKEPESQAASFISKDEKATGTEESKETESKEEDLSAEELQFSEEADPITNNLITQYLEAKLEPNIESLTPLVEDIATIDIDSMERETSIIEKYDNVVAHVIDSPKEGTSIVYVEYSIKFYGIETSAPAATRFIVVKESDKTPYIYNGEIEDGINTFINEFEETNTYKDFVDNVNNKLLAALEQDTALAEFNSKLNAGEESTEPESSPETETDTESESTKETQADTEGETTAAQ